MSAAVTALLVMGALVLGGAPAEAHTDLVSTAPLRDGVVSIATSQLVMVFVDDVSGGEIEVRDPDGVEVTRGSTGGMRRVVEVALDLRRPGRHQVDYRVVGSDGHVISGTWSFRVVAASGGEASGPGPQSSAALRGTSQVADAGSQATSSGSSGLWMLVVIAGAGIAVVVRAASRPGPT
ncbi:copper resistance protein CopC [Nocardioides sp.]|uniref:copper resistance CopC family protein n=1 Tax=Nocardioides sp. TaxID=35761 RepID=UPI002869FDC7|nr:copper resistance protein CopC [Nocardioides sp.]